MDDARTVWCGNLSDQITEELLYELFLQAGPLDRVKIPTDREGRKSNFAFITFKHEVSVNYAAELLNGIRLYDKNLNVKPRNVGNNQQNFNKGNGNMTNRQRGFENMALQSPQVQMLNQNPFIGNVSYEDLMRLGQMMHVPNNFNMNVGYNDQRQYQQNYSHDNRQRHWEEPRNNSFQDRDQSDRRPHRPDYGNSRKHESPNRNRRNNDRSNYGGRSRRNHY